MTLICCWSLQFNLFSFSVLLFYPLVLHTDGGTCGQKHRRTDSDVITLTKISRIDGYYCFLTHGAPRGCSTIGFVSGAETLHPE